MVIMWRMSSCHGWLVNAIDARTLSLSAKGGDTILSCANILHVGAEAYGLLMPSPAPGNNIIKRMGGGGIRGKVEIREETNEKERAEGGDEKACEV